MSETDELGDKDMEQPELAAQLVIDANSLEMNGTYTFAPPLPVANVNMSTKHRLGRPPSMRHPNFLIKRITADGIYEGKLVYINNEQSTEYRIFIFSSEIRFKNETTGEFEVAHYTVSTKVKRQAVDGIQVRIQKKLDETLKGETNE